MANPLIAVGSFGPYTLESLLGSGRASEVYRAYDQRHQRVVALKILSGSFTADRDYRERFDQVSRVLTELSAPNLLPVNAHGELQGRLFVDTRLVTGPNLGARVRAGAMPDDQAAELINQLAAALDALHSAGIAHGDVKPSDVLCTEEGFLLADAGLAHPRARPRYPAPEWSEGRLPDPGADVYALACLVGEFATRANATATGGDARAAELLAALSRGMAANPASRYRTASELAEAVTAALAGARPAAGGAGMAWWKAAPKARVTPPPAGLAPAGGWPGWARPPGSQADPGGHPQPPAGAPDWWQGRLSGVHTVTTAKITIGRAPDNDVVVPDLLVSKRHAELRRTGAQWRIVDLKSWNGTFLNGQRITDSVIQDHDVVGVGHTLLQLVGDQLVEYTDEGDITFGAADLVVTKKGRRLLDAVSFTLRERSLVAVIGPSGAGKSTLLAALTGFRPADQGEVHYAGRDLYTDYDELRYRIGFVPQEDILHPQLTVRRALRYAARLRFPADVPRSERERRVEEVLAELGLTNQARQRISSLSGGQRKRTSTALELLTRPSLLFLDEPTSGLDPGLKKQVMVTLRQLADEGRTVVVVSHDETNLGMCDRLLVLATGGKLAYFGPPQEALRYFQQKDFPEVFTLLNEERTVDWAARYRQSPEAARYLRTPAAPIANPASRPMTAPAPVPRQQSPLTQFQVLCARYLAVIAADWQYLVFLAALPLALSALAQLVSGPAGLSMIEKAKDRGGLGSPAQLLLVLVIASAFMGFAGAFRELVKERAIYRREQAIGLTISAYLGSKLAVLGVITAIQAVGLGVLSTLGRPPPDRAVVLSDPTLEVIIALVAVTASMMALGLLVSASIANADRGMPLLVVILMLQLILCGGLFPLNGNLGIEQLSWLVPARWGFAMGAATTEIPQRPGGEPDPLWTHSVGYWLLDLFVLCLITAVFVAATHYRLRRSQPGRRPAR